MARSDLLIKLIKAALANDRAMIEKSTETIIAEERKKQHHNFADRLTMALRATPPRGKEPDLSLKRTNGGSFDRSAGDFLAEISPKKSLSEIMLSNESWELFEEIVEEQHRADILRSHGLEPRHRILLAGPPGNGKTSLAEALAYELAVPFYIVRYETVVGSFLGETSSRLKKIFDYARTMPCVLFFDEFDTLGKERGDSHETGEIKRVVSALLLQIDELPSYTVVVTATNHPELLDRAVWRRFQLRMNLPRPTKIQLQAYFDNFFLRFKEDLGVQTSTLAKNLSGSSFAEAEDFCLDIQRRHVLAMGGIHLKQIVTARMKHWRNRFNPASNNQ